MRKLLVVAPLLVVLVELAAGCDATRRDLTYCDQATYKVCGYGYTCDFAQERCVPIPDGGADASVKGDASADAKDASIGGSDAIVDSQPADGLAMDAMDTRPLDAAGTCSVDNDCAVAAAGSFCVNSRCVRCRSGNDCSNAAGAPFCSAQNTCVSCASAGTVDGGASAACSGSAPVCNASTGSCVQCLKNTDCPAAKAFCSQNQCVACDAVRASTDGGVSDGGGVGGRLDAGTVDGGSSPSVGCSGATPVCVSSASASPKAGQCVGCASNSDCSGNTPICDIAGSFTCKACTSDSQCTASASSGVCMFHDGGRCATVAETIFVKNSASCSGGAGTSTSPFCDSQSALNAVTAIKRVIVMRGPSSDGLSPVSSTPGGSLISLIAQNGATTSAGASIAIHVTSGDVYLRGLSIVNGDKAGIVVEPGATLRLDRCLLKNNSGGGVLVKAGANFDIANSIFDNNGPGLATTTTTFGGIFLGGGAPSGGLSRFWFNTVVNNQDRGVICADPTQSLTGMLLYGNVNGDFLSCVLDGSSRWSSGSPVPAGLSSDTSNPGLDTNDRLTSTSACHDYVAASVAHPVDDVDGESRPKGAKLDCGADEL